MAYTAVGDGPPAVWIRTVMPTTANPTGLTRWAEQRTLSELTRHFTVYAVGRRPNLKRGVTMADIAAHYAEAIEHHFGHAVNVIGLSTAGSIGLQLAADHPSAVKRLVVAAASCRLGDDGRLMQHRYADLLARGRYRRAHAALTPGITDSRLGQRVLSYLMALIPRPDDPDGMVAMLLAEDTFDVCERLHEITVPTLVIGGDRDQFYPPRLVRRTGQDISGSELRMYRNRKHHTITRDPRFNADVVAFLTGHETG
jgi:pimeloyl-ACP methyl ester carboxylesterase